MSRKCLFLRDRVVGRRGRVTALKSRVAWRVLRVGVIASCLLVGFARTQLLRVDDRRILD